MTKKQRDELVRKSQEARSRVLQKKIDKMVAEIIKEAGTEK